jgi:hypothetical protein
MRRLTFLLFMARRCGAVLLLSLAVAGACTSKGDGGAGPGDQPGPGGPPGISITLSPRQFDNGYGLIRATRRFLRCCAADRNRRAVGRHGIGQHRQHLSRHDDGDDHDSGERGGYDRLLHHHGHRNRHGRWVRVCDVQPDHHARRRQHAYLTFLRATTSTFLSGPHDCVQALHA